MRTADFHYDLPPDRIAHQPAASRDESRLMVVDRATGGRLHRVFRDLPSFLRPGDVLVLNDSRVIPARLRAMKEGSGGLVEVLLIEAATDGTWWSLLRPGKRVRPGTRLQVLDRSGRPVDAGIEVVGKNGEGHCRLRFADSDGLPALLEAHGEMPLPPYIRPPGGESARDRERYQTVYARHAGSVAAPTAGLHFTPGLLKEISARGVEVCFVTLHVGAGTFLPVKTDAIAGHRMHSERFVLPETTSDAITRARAGGGRVVAVGTTTVRVLESVARGVPKGRRLPPGPGVTDIFLHPPCPFHVVDALVTNFHLPGSTLLMLVSAFADPGDIRGRERMLASYREAIAEGYRFFSYGDAMLIQ